ncbi:MAG: hypothetical protein HPY85_09205 [Anaerolineae bacterium]|nr:hypothetical protein [Anaerolineae bacterium]
MTKTNFANVNVLDNFYQTSSYYPMPVVLISTVAETGQTNLGPYSLCFPHIIGGQHAMMLISRATSNTAENIRRTGLAAINFIPDKRKYLKNSVMLGYPGETTEEKMKNSIFTLMPSMRKEQQQGVRYPEIVNESIQVFECTLDPQYDYRYSEMENHFVLRIDQILMQDRWKKSLFEGNGRFPNLPVDFGYRNSTCFWFANHRKPFSIAIPKSKGISVDTVQYAADRLDPDIVWEHDACARLVKVPRVFLNTVLKGINDEARRRGMNVVTARLVEEMNDKRRNEKKA